MKRMALILTIIFTICMFAGCGSNNASASLGTGSSKTTSVSPAAESKNEESSKAVSRDETDPSANGEKSQAQESVSTEESILYIGMEDYFREYPVDIPRAGFQNSDEVDAYIESLIGEIANLTGWNLEYSVNSYKTITVQFSMDSFAAPEIQKEEFHTFDAPQLIETILDSVQETIRENLDDGNLDVYFSTMDDQDLEFPAISMHVPMEEPYHGLVDD